MNKIVMGSEAERELERKTYPPGTIGAFIKEQKETIERFEKLKKEAKKK